MPAFYDFLALRPSINFCEGLSFLSFRCVTYPATWAAHPLLQFRDDSSDMLAPLLWTFHGDGPADPLIAGKRRDVFPYRKRLGVGRQGLPQVCRQCMRNPTRYLFIHTFMVALTRRLRIHPTSRFYATTFFLRTASAVAHRFGERRRCILK